jgi:hypothetical protein
VADAPTKNPAFTQESTNVVIPNPAIPNGTGSAMVGACVAADAAGVAPLVSEIS